MIRLKHLLTETTMVLFTSVIYSVKKTTLLTKKRAPKKLIIILLLFQLELASRFII
jgi:hypothetical protein